MYDLRIMTFDEAQEFIEFLENQVSDIYKEDFQSLRNYIYVTKYGKQGERLLEHLFNQITVNNTIIGHK